MCVAGERLKTKSGVRKREGEIERESECRREWKQKERVRGEGEWPSV